MRINDGGGGSSVSIPPPPPPPARWQASPPVFRNHPPIYGPFLPRSSGTPASFFTFRPLPPPPPPQQSEPELIRQARVTIVDRANSYRPSTPKLTVDDPIARAVRPVATQAQREDRAANAALKSDSSAAQQTRARLDALYDDMDRRGSRPATLQSARTLETQMSRQQQQVRSDQHRVDAAGAKSSAAAVVGYTQQAQADGKAAVASGKAAAAAHDALGKSLPHAVTPTFGQTLNSAQVAGLDAHQKTVYQGYVGALARANADQARVNSDLAAVKLNQARLQTYASDPRYGTIAADATKAVNRQLRPYHLALRAPQSIDPAAAGAQLGAAQRLATYSNAIRDAADAHAGVLTNPQLVAARRKVDAIKAKLDAAEKSLCLADNAPLKQQYKAAVADLQKVALPVANDLAIKDAYVGKLQAAAEVHDRQVGLDKVRAEFDHWKTAHPHAADSSNPHSSAVSAAAGGLSLARQRETALSTAFEAAVGEVYAQQQAKQVAAQVDGARNQYAAAETALSKLPKAPANVYAGRGSFYQPAASDSARQRKSFEQAAADAKSLYHRGADPAAATQAVVTKLSATADQQIADYNYASALAGGASPAEVATLHDRQLAATHEVERADFVLKLDPALRAPLTAADQKALTDKQAVFDRLHLFQSGEHIDGDQALAKLEDDKKAEDALVADRGWLQSTADFFNGDPSRLQSYIDKRVEAVTAENAKHAAGQVSDGQYQADLHQILANYGADTQAMNAAERKTDAHWQTAEQVTDFALATVAGVATGGVAGAVLAFGVYEATQAMSDLVVAGKGGDMRADGQLSLSAWAAEGFRGSDFRMAATTAADDAINAATLMVGGGAGARATEAVAARWGAKATEELADGGLAALDQAGTATLEGTAPAAGRAAFAADGADVAGTVKPLSWQGRVASQAVGGTVNQAVGGAGQILTTGVNLGAAGQLGTPEGQRELGDAIKTQLLYLATAPIAGAASGALPVGHSQPAPLARVAMQGAANLATNIGQSFVAAEVANGHGMTEDDWILAGIGMVPAAAQDLAMHVQRRELAADLGMRPLGGQSRASGDPAALEAGMKVIDAFRGRMDSAALDGTQLQVVGPRVFARAYQKAGGRDEPAAIDAFTVSTPQGSRVYLRSDRLSAGVVAHEIVHAMTSDAFRKLASTLVVDPSKPHSNVKEGVIELLATAAVPRNDRSPYGAEARIAQTIRDTMGETAFDKAVFQKDPEALALLRRTALSLRDAPVSERPAANWALDASMTPHRPGGGQPPAGGFSRAMSPREFSRYLHALDQKPKLRGSAARHVYVIATSGKPRRTIAMNDGNIVYRGVIKAGWSTVKWDNPGAPARLPEEHLVVIADQPYTGGSDRLVTRHKSALREAGPVVAGVAADVGGVISTWPHGLLYLGLWNAAGRGPLNVVQLKSRIPEKAAPYPRIAAASSFVANGTAYAAVGVMSGHLWTFDFNAVGFGSLTVIGLGQIGLGFRSFYSGYAALRSRGTFDKVESSDHTLKTIADRNGLPEVVLNRANGGTDKNPLRVNPAPNELTKNEKKISYRQIARESNKSLEEVLEEHGRQLPLVIGLDRQGQTTTDLVRPGEDLRAFAARHSSTLREIRNLNKKQVPDQYVRKLSTGDQVRIPDSFDNSRGLTWKEMGRQTGRWAQHLIEFNSAQGAKGGDQAPDVVYIPPTSNWDGSPVARRLQMIFSGTLGLGNALEIVYDLHTHDWLLAGGAAGVALGSGATVLRVWRNRQGKSAANAQVVTSVSFSFKAVWKLLHL